MAGSICPEKCSHATVHYCGNSGNHCDIHCICSCFPCLDYRNSKKILFIGAGGNTEVADALAQQLLRADNKIDISISPTSKEVPWDDERVKQYDLILITSALKADDSWYRLKDVAKRLNVPTAVMTLRPDELAGVAQTTIDSNSPSEEIIKKILELAKV